MRVCLPQKEFFSEIDANVYSERTAHQSVALPIVLMVVVLLRVQAKKDGNGFDGEGKFRIGG